LIVATSESVYESAETSCPLGTVPQTLNVFGDDAPQSATPLGVKTPPPLAFHTVVPGKVQLAAGVVADGW
jgi:hypothetical protein